MPFAPGACLGPYEITAPLGAGGMGEVYKARDTRLERTVAVKVLPEEIAKREDLRARFEREARGVASLSHPNICSLFDSVKVLDFGLEKSASSKPGPTEETLTKVLTTEGTVMGTPQYMAPELGIGGATHGAMRHRLTSPTPAASAP